MPDEKEPPTEKRIIVDEDWKSQVQAEKEQPQPTEPPATKSHEGRPSRGQIPPASFGMLVTTLATQAMVSMAAVPNPLTQETETDLVHAKHFVDTLGVLEEKTKGNLTAEEGRLLNAVLYDLRMQFVEAKAIAEKLASEKQ